MDDIVKEALEKFEHCQNLDREQRELAVEDLKFIHAEDGQWSEDAATKRADRPRFTIDRISGAIDQVIGDQRQTRRGPSVLPQKNGTERGAEIRKGMIRSIEALSNADTIYDNAFMEQLISGYGGWRIFTVFDIDGEEIDNDSELDASVFDQIIRMGMVKTAASSLFFDPDAEDYTKSDGDYAFLVWHMDKDAFKIKYPDATEADFSAEIYNTTTRRSWFGEDSVMLAEHWVKEQYKKKLGLLSDGRIIDLEEEKDVLDELMFSGIEVVDERKVNTHKIYRYIMNGAEILKDKELWPGKYIPLIPVYGKTAVVQDEHFVRGMVRKAKDSQRVYNYATSAAIEAAALTPKNPYFITPEELGEYLEQWSTFNTKNPPYMLFNPDPALGGQRPMRDQPAPIQPALLSQIQQAATDIHATTGLEPASLGNVPELKSGRAIMAQQAMGDRGTYVYQSNFERSMAYSYQVMGDLIPRIYDTQRKEKILGNEDQVEEVVINQKYDDFNQVIVDQQTGQEVIVNDLTVGNYSYSVSKGPAQHTKREETLDQLMKIVETDMEFKPVIFDLIVKNMDINHKDEIVKRIRKRQVEQGLVEPTEDEIKEFGLDQPKEPDPMQKKLVENLEEQNVLLQVQQQKTVSEIENIEAKTQKLIADSQKVIVDSFNSAVKAIVEKFNAGLPVTPQDVDIVEGQGALVEESQIDVIENQQIAGSLPMNAKQPQGMQPQGMQPQGMQPQGPPQGPMEQPQGNIPGVVIPGPNEI